MIVLVGETEEQKELWKEEDEDIQPIESELEDAESSSLTVFEIETFPADYPLDVLKHKWESGDIELHEFQRQFVWNEVRSSKLIESFLMGIPVPPIFLYSERKSQKYIVIDGQQRLKSVFYFFDGYFGGKGTGKKRKFKLKGLGDNSKWNNKTFDEFEEEDKRRLKNSVLRAIIVKQIEPKDDTSMYHIFERLNTGGIVLTNQELRNCIYGGKLRDLLIEINKLAIWRQVFGKDKVHTRQKDVELILRFFTLQDLGGYKKPLNESLSKYMRENIDPPDENLQEMKELFERTCNEVYNNLGNKPFHIWSGLNAAFYDSVMVAFSKHLNEIPKDIKERYEGLKENDDFKENAIKTTTDDDVVRNRFRIAENELFGSDSDESRESR